MPTGFPGGMGGFTGMPNMMRPPQGGSGAGGAPPNIQNLLNSMMGPRPGGAHGGAGAP